MPRYAWKGLDPKGKQVAGTREADGPKVLRRALRKESVFLTEMRGVEGGGLADAMSAHPKLFPELYTNMVRSGETAGNLDAVLERLADFMDQQQALRSKVSGAMTYPILMMVIGTLVMGVLMVAVVPKITAIFEDQGKALPWNTQVLIFVAGVT